MLLYMYVAPQTDRRKRETVLMNSSLPAKPILHPKKTWFWPEPTLTMESPAGKSNVEILSSCLMMSGSDA